MKLEEFVEAFAEEFDETPVDQFSPACEFKSLEEWGSLTALSIIAMIDEKMEKRITGSDIRTAKTIEDLYRIALNK